MSDWIGWVATGAFALSYLAKSPVTLRRIQAGAALLWILYGISMKAAPVIVANTVVAAMAVVSTLRRKEVAEIRTQ
jgi:hypothetical protein